MESPLHVLERDKDPRSHSFLTRSGIFAFASWSAVELSRLCIVVNDMKLLLFVSTRFNAHMAPANGRVIVMFSGAMTLGFFVAEFESVSL